MKPLANLNLKLSKLLLLALCAAASLACSSAETISGTPGVAEKSAVVNFTELADRADAEGTGVPAIPRQYSPKPAPARLRQAGQGLQAASNESGTHSKIHSAAVSPPPSSSFLGALDNGFFIPPDTMGTVGPDHLIVALNGTFKIQTRTGATVRSISLSAFWDSVGPFVDFPFDPKVYYDSFKERWIIVTCVDAELPSDSILIGVSQTKDPTKNWNLHKIDADSTDTDWADYPSVGYNGKWIVASFNMFGNTDGGYKGSHIYVFDKANLYSGGTAKYTLLQDNSGFTQCPAVMFDETNPTMYIVESFTEQTLRISTITGPVGSEGLNIGSGTATSPKPWSFGAGNIAPQKGSPVLILNNDARIQNVMYRNGSLWCTHTVFYPAGGSPSRTGVQWWQLNPNGITLQRGVIEDPSGLQFFGFPSIAVNKNNDAFVGYSRFSANQYASANYSFRFGQDAPNTMQGDRVFKDGEAPYTKDFGSGRVRWGDYSSTSIDPLNDLSFWTIQEYASSGGQWGTWWASLDLSAPPDGILEVGVSPVTQSSLIAGVTTNIFVTVTDSFPVTNATVVATIPGLPDLIFKNDGVAPDAILGDAVYSASLQVPDNVSVLNVRFKVTAPGKADFTMDAVYNLYPVPKNDNFASASKVPPAGAFGGTLIEASNNFATVENGEPLHGGDDRRGASVWWNWSPSVSGKALVDSSGSGFDTLIGVYTGSSVKSLTEIASVNDVGSKRQAYLTFDAVAGTTYRIAVAGTTSDQVGPIRLRIEPAGLPDTTNPTITLDFPPSGLVLQTNSVQLMGRANDPIPNASGLRSIRVVNLTSDPQVAVTATGTTNWVQTANLEQGTNIFQVFSIDYADNISDSKFVTVYYFPNDSKNDLFASFVDDPEHQALPGLTGKVVGSTLLATKETGEPNHAGNEGGKSIWYTFLAPANGVLLLSTEGSSFDTLMGLYTGRFVSDLVEVDSNDDASDASGFSEIVTAVEKGTTYHIAVDGYGATSGKVVLQYTFTESGVFPVTVQSSVGGSVTPGSGSYPKGSTVTFSATPDPYYQFDHFETTQGVFTKNPLALSITGATTVTAKFVDRKYTDGFETGDFSQLPWNSRGWEVQDRVLSRGKFAAGTVHIDDRQTNSLVLMVDLLGGLGTFEYRVSTETNYDRLDLYINGDLRNTWSGEIPWSVHSFEVPSGLVTLEWRYTKDNALSGGLDAVFIDNLDLPLSKPVVSRPSLKIVKAGANRTVSLSGQAAQTYTVQVSGDLKNWSNLTTVTADSTGNVSFQDAGVGLAYRFYRVRTP